MLSFLYARSGERRKAYARDALELVLEHSGLHSLTWSFHHEPFWRCLLGLFLCLGSVGWAQEKVIIDTDIGDDVDDAFALALAVKSPELQVLGVMTTFGDTETRAKITDRFLAEVGRRRFLCWRGRRRRQESDVAAPVCGESFCEEHRTGTRWSFCWSRFGSIRARLR